MPELSVVKKGFNYSQDGPGNRLVYHLFGCNLHCPWCANPETVFEGVKTEQISPKEILRQSLSAKSIMIDSGGVTFTGGEPTLQRTALTETLELLYENQIHTVIQTNGTDKELYDFFPLLSLIIIDFKHYDNEKHKSVTGAPNTRIIENLHKACAFGLPVWVRTPLIHGFNTADEDIEGFLNICKALEQRNASFEFLPYHEYGRDKWMSLGKGYSVIDGAVSPERVKQFEAAYTDAGLKVIRT